jgi:[protein-PII] uridylyltransferase
LIGSLTERVRSQLRGEPLPAAAPLSAEQRRLLEAAELAVHVEPGVGSTWSVTVVAPDQRGLLAAVAGVLALHKLSVRAATMRTEDGVAVDTWHVEPELGDPPVLETLREDVRRALDRTLDVADLLTRREEARRSRPRAVPAAPRVDVVSEASADATVLEVRAADRLGLLHRLGRALSLAGVSVRSARANTIGAEVVDVFYVVDESGRPLGDVRAREVARILRDVAS